jgi:hypothetical protein
MKHCGTVLHGWKIVDLPSGSRSVSADRKPDFRLGDPIE